MTAIIRWTRLDASATAPQPSNSKHHLLYSWQLEPPFRLQRWNLGAKVPYERTIPDKKVRTSQEVKKYHFRSEPGLWFRMKAREKEFVDCSFTVGEECTAWR